MYVMFVLPVDRWYQQQICRAGYKVIEVFLHGDSRKNELYLSRFIPFFEAQVCKIGNTIIGLEMVCIVNILIYILLYFSSKRNNHHS